MENWSAQNHLRIVWHLCLKILRSSVSHHHEIPLSSWNPVQFLAQTASCKQVLLNAQTSLFPWALSILCVESRSEWHYCNPFSSALNSSQTKGFFSSKSMTNLFSLRKKLAYFVPKEELERNKVSLRHTTFIKNFHRLMSLARSYKYRGKRGLNLYVAFLWGSALTVGKR